MRPIDAEELINKMQDHCCGECDLCIYRRYENACYFCGLIEEAPTVEPKKGKWVLNDTLFGSTSFRCSVCNDVTDDVPTCMNKPLYNYCPVCGAEMEADDD